MIILTVIFTIGTLYFGRELALDLRRNEISDNSLVLAAALVASATMAIICGSLSI